MVRTLRLSHKSLVPKSLTELWQEFVKTRDIKFPHVCNLVRIILATPPNSTWAECIYSKLEQLCQKRRNQIDVNHPKDQFFLELLNLPVKECMVYEKDINSCKGAVSLMKLFTSVVTSFVTSLVERR